MLLEIVLFRIPFLYNRWRFLEKINIDKSEHAVIAPFGLSTDGIIECQI